MRIADWLEHIDSVKDQHLNGPTRTDSAAWLAHFLRHCAGDANHDLDAGWFAERLKAGKVLVLLDGLDEAPDERRRERALRLIRAVAKAYGDCPLVVTSRPVAYADRTALPGFDLSRIEPLGDEAVASFLTRWSQALFKDNTAGADKHRKDLLTALHARPNIRRLARNTVMLTALAVVHWNEKRLPEQRAELYESILVWLARSREQRPGRTRPDRTLEILRELALAMQLHPEGRQVQVPRRWAAERIAGAFGGPQNHAVVDRAERFLEEEEIDSGIVVARGHDIRFWHLTFQEYLAARAVGGRGEAQQRTLLLESPRRFYAPEWREVVLLLGGVLYTQGRAKVDGLVGAVLDALGEKPTRAGQARAAGLLGTLMRDLDPFGYRPADPRYARILEAALAVFDPQQAPAIPLPDRIAAADALALAGDPRLDWAHPERWVELPGGRFWMGAQKNDEKSRNYDPEANDREAPVHEVLLGGFRIARFPVTVSEYARFLEDEDHRDPRWWQAGGADKPPEPDEWESQQAHPSRAVVYVSWHQAMAFCAWLSERLAVHRGAHGAPLLPPGYQVRLPTEAQWEYAARGVQGRRYPWGDEPPDPQRANFSDTHLGHPSPVSVFPGDRTPEGVVDLAGNVSEWCLDPYDEGFYAGCQRQGLVSDPLAPGEGGALRVLRGGAFFSGAWYLRATFRFWFVPWDRFRNIGFRCVLAPPREP